VVFPEQLEHQARQVSQALLVQVGRLALEGLQELAVHQVKKFLN
jgi:hypothetical protein